MSFYLKVRLLDLLLSYGFTGNPQALAWGFPVNPVTQK